MHKISLTAVHRQLYLVILVFAAGCGGGGGGGGGGGVGPQYTGNTNAAVITEGNASELTAGAFGSDGTATTLLGLKIESSSASSNPGSGLVLLARRLNRNARDTVRQFNAVVSGVQINQNDPCDGGTGSVQTSGTLSDDGSFTGTLMVNFIGCLIDGVIVNGPATLRVDAFSFAFPQGIPADSTLSFENLTIRGPGVSVDARGTLRDELNFGASSETVTINLVTRNNNNSGKTSKSENLKFVYVYNDIFNPSSFTASVSGRLFDHDEGFVDISTITPLFFNALNQLFPDSGQILLTGSANRSIRTTALSATAGKLDLDLDGDSLIDRTVTLKWTDLTGPIGADLGDTDGDGMHNAWETANGLLPNSAADASQDKDFDGASNLAEYHAGTDPNNALSFPPTVGLSISVTDSPDPVGVNGTINYLITVSNSASSAASNVVVTDTLPVGVNLVSVSSVLGSCSGTTMITCNLGTLGGFGLATIAISATPTVEGVLTNSVSVTTSAFDPDLSNNSATTTTSVSASVAGTIVQLAASDLIYDVGTQRIYAAIPGDPGSVVPINPLTGALGTPILVGHDPVKLARSDDGQYLYVGLDGTIENDVHRIVLATQTVDLTFSLGSDPMLRFVEDMEVLPGAPQSVAVSRKYKGVSPRHAGVAVFDAGVQRAVTGPTHTGSNVIEFSASAGLLYGYNNETTEFGFRRMNVGASGVAVQDVHDSFHPNGALISGFGVNIHFHAGLIYTTTGRVIDPVTRTLVDTFSLSSSFANLVVADATVGRVFYLTRDDITLVSSLRAFDITSRQPLGTVIINNFNGTASSLIRWGPKGLAFRASDGTIRLIEHSALIP